MERHCVVDRALAFIARRMGLNPAKHNAFAFTLGAYAAQVQVEDFLQAATSKPRAEL